MSEDVYYFNQRSENKDIIRFHICGITYPDKNYSIKRQCSDIACIEYIEDGTGSVNAGDSKFCPCEGDSYFLHTGIRHHYFSDKEKPWKKYFVNVSGSLLESLIDGYKLNNIYYFPNLDIKNELCRIIELSKNSAHDCTAGLIAVINEIFLKMHSSVAGMSAYDGIAREMKDFLNTQITEKFKIDKLCRHVSRSESQTIRIFKNAYGVTPYSYVLDKKISLAKRLLKNTNLSVKQIAAKLNFADEYYFSNFFKQKVGVTPSKYRKTE